MTDFVICVQASQEIKAAIESLEDDDHLDDSMMQ